MNFCSVRTRSSGSIRLPPFCARAFSLVELLVVVAILALLAALLLPALGQARETAKRTTCLSNLRQMAIAANAYTYDNNNQFPVAYYSAATPTQSITYCWDLTTVSNADGTTQVIPGLLWRTSDPARIQQCPSFTGAANFLNDPFTGYNYNTSYIGHGADEAIPDPVRIASLSHPSSTALFGDGQWVAGADKFMRAPFPNPGDATFSGRFGGTQGFRHQSKTNVAFGDGHGESLADRFTANADGADNVAPGTGFLSIDNSLYNSQ